MTELLFEVPWWLVSLLAVIGIVLFINGNKSQVIKVRNLGLGLVLLAIIWALVSHLVDTDAKRVKRGTLELVQAAVDRDWAAFQARLAPDASFTIGSHAKPGGAAVVTAEAKQGVEAVRLKSAHIQKLEMEQTKTLITVKCEIFSTQESFAPVETSTWDFDWEKTPDGWKLREIRLVKLRDIAGDQLDDMIPRGITR